ncbi:MAG: hypothetical protein JJD93_09380 [Ilumatobacteraceae bacterium]|nr:hypothetical protein [Ilumatobacteraceae bacterium]
MAISMRDPALRPRRHGECIEPADRRALERAGWRTMMDYRENHVRGRDGRLLGVEAVWVAEAERFDGMMVAASAIRPTVEEAWAALRADIENSRYRTLSRIRLLER